MGWTFGDRFVQCLGRWKRTVGVPNNWPNNDTKTTRRHPSNDRLYNPEAVIPQRPTITNIQWISGTQYISPADMDILSMSSPSVSTGNVFLT